MVISDCMVSYSWDEGGVVCFELVFVEVGEFGFLIVMVNIVQQVQMFVKLVKDFVFSCFFEVMVVVNMVRVKVVVIQVNVVVVYGVVNNYIKLLFLLFFFIFVMVDFLMNVLFFFGVMVFLVLVDLEWLFSSFGSFSSLVLSSGVVIIVFVQVLVFGGQDVQGVQSVLVGLM